jgi:hypothetical protein
MSQELLLFGVAIIALALWGVRAAIVGNVPPPLGRGNEGQPVCQGP